MFNRMSESPDKLFNIKVKEQSLFSNNFILLNHIQICFITIYDGCLTQLTVLQLTELS